MEDLAILALQGCMTTVLNHIQLTWQELSVILPLSMSGLGRPLRADVYAFGVFLLEVTSGRRPIETRQSEEDGPLIVWVLSCWSRGEILSARDPKLGSEFVAEEVELVLKLGLLCLNFKPRARPSMRQVVQYLEGDLPLHLQVLSSALVLSARGLAFEHDEESENHLMASRPEDAKEFCVSSRVLDSLLSSGR